MVDGAEHLSAFAAEDSLTLALGVAASARDIPIQLPTGNGYTYSANDASVGDLDGDGQYEIVLKWDPTG